MKLKPGKPPRFSYQESSTEYFLFFKTYPANAIILEANERPAPLHQHHVPRLQLAPLGTPVFM